MKAQEHNNLQRAEDTRKELNLLSKSVRIQQEQQELTRLENLFLEFLKTEAPSNELLKDETLDSSVTQDYIRPRLPSKWLATLHILLRALSDIERNPYASDRLKQRASQIYEDIKRCITPHHKTLLALAELTRENKISPDYKPSQFAVLLCKYKLFPRMKNTARYAAWKKAGGEAG